MAAASFSSLTTSRRTPWRSDAVPSMPSHALYFRMYKLSCRPGSTVRDVSSVHVKLSHFHAELYTCTTNFFGMIDRQLHFVSQIKTVCLSVFARRAAASSRECVAASGASLILCPSMASFPTS